MKKWFSSSAYHSTDFGTTEKQSTDFDVSMFKRLLKELEESLRALEEGILTRDSLFSDLRRLENAIQEIMTKFSNETNTKQHLLLERKRLEAELIGIIIILRFHSKDKND